MIKRKEKMSENELNSFIKLNDLLFDLVPKSHITIVNNDTKELIYEGLWSECFINLEKSGYLVRRFLVKNNSLIMEVF